MFKHPRAFVIIGQILTFMSFFYLAFYSYSVSTQYPASSQLLLKSLFQALELLSIAVAGISIGGMAISLRPYGRYQTVTTILSAVFDGLLGFVLILGVFINGTSQMTPFDWFLIVALLGAFTFLILGVILIQKEKKKTVSPVAMTPMMKKYARGKILTGQILALPAFIYLALSSFTAAFAAELFGRNQLEAFSTLIGFIRLAEVPIAIYGIIHAVAPYGKFQKETAIASAVFNGAFGILLFIDLVSPTDYIVGKGITAVSMMFLFTAMGFLISGLNQAKKESTTGIFSQEPAPNQTLEDLFALKKIYEKELISEQEYIEKKKDVLNRDFSGQKPV